MTEFNYLIYCPTCKGDRDFLGGTSKAICLTCLREVDEPILREKEGFEARETEREEALNYRTTVMKVSLLIALKEILDLMKSERFSSAIEEIEQLIEEVK